MPHQETTATKGGPSAAIPRHNAFEISAMLAYANAPELAERFDLSTAALEDPETKIELPRLHELLETLVEATGDPYFGVHFGASVTKPKFKRRVGALGLMMLSSPSLASGIRALVRHQNLFNEGDRYAIVDDGSTTHLSFEPWGPERVGQIQMAEKTVAQMLGLLRFGESSPRPIAIRFGHAERPGSEALSKALGLSPTFGAERTEVVVRTEDLQCPIRGADPDMFRFFDRQLNRRTRDEDGDHARSGSHVERVTSAVQEALHRGQYSSSEIARRLGLPLRTLQRRLADEGTQLKSIVERVRRIRAEALLEAGLSVGEVAILLGYSDTAPFVRAFKRWLGTTPAAWREESRQQI